MTPSQERVYNYILTYHKKHGVVPSTITTAKHFKVSKQAIAMTYSKLVALKKLNKYAVVSHFELSTL